LGKCGSKKAAAKFLLAYVTAIAYFCRMKIVTYRGTEHVVYEGRNEFKEDNPNTELKLTLRETQTGDWIESTSGHIVQCLERKHYYFKRKDRPSYIDKHYFTFPRVRTFRYEKDLDKKPSYFPSISQNALVEDVFKGKLLSKPRIKLFALGVRMGLPLKVAYINAFGKYNYKQVLFLLAQQEIANYIFTDNPRLNNMRKELEAQGVNKETLAEKIKEILDDDKANPSLKKWALETSMQILDDEQQSFINPVLAASIHFNALPSHNGSRSQLPEHIPQSLPSADNP
jgi:hypothetical protein